MKMKKLAVVVAAAAVLALGASPAFAEGYWSSSMTGARPGFNSRSWQDSHSDHLSTIATLSNCSYGNAAGLVKSVGLTLWAEWGLLPDQSIDTITKNCGTYNWGEQTRSDRYHWSVFSIVNNTSNVHSVSANPVTTSY